jgi:hypothetical protein
MTLAEVWSELEAEQQWREAELRFLQNQVALQANRENQDLLRRSLVVMLYAHFEGISRFILALYVRVVNETGLTCGEANTALAAASLADVFMALRDPFSKCAEFKNQLPDDSDLHRFARDREFVENTDGFAARRLKVPDSVVDLEGNLKPVVLRKLLYRLGLEHDHVAAVEGNIHKLLNYRNSIAHGSFRRGISEPDYEGLREGVVVVVRALTRQVMGALGRRQYKRAS